MVVLLLLFVKLWIKNNITTGEGVIAAVAAAAAAAAAAAVEVFGVATVCRQRGCYYDDDIDVDDNDDPAAVWVSKPL